MLPSQKRHGDNASAFDDRHVQGPASSASKKSRRINHPRFVSAILLAGALWAFLCLAGCSISSGTPAGAIVGRANAYDYSPSVIQVDRVQQFWWCGEGRNLADPSHDTDVILHESINLETGQRVGPAIVLAETPGAWDSAYICNPQVVRGSFQDPLGDGTTYTYAMYYEATAEVSGFNNSIGVAFSNNGSLWKKYPWPVIQTTYQNVYGPAQPAVYNSDGKQAIWLFYENDEAPLPTDSHVQATSSDGVHFRNIGTLTTNGLNIPAPLASWGNLAYDPASAYWYASFNLTTRSLATTGNKEERGSYGFQLYKIPQNDLLVGRTGWQQLKTFDTNLTGYETLFDAGFARDPYGNVYEDGNGNLEVFPSFANVRFPWDVSPASAASLANVTTWDIGQYAWSPTGSPLYELGRYWNGTTHQVTTGWIDSNGGFFLEKTLGKVYQYPQQEATVALYGCKAGNVTFFISLDGNCEGQRMLGINGYIYAHPIVGVALSPLYRCIIGNDYFASIDPLCEGKRTKDLLGYILSK